jgi:OHCU decarboxylase
MSHSREASGAGRVVSPAVQWLNTSPMSDVSSALTNCCGSRAWADRMLAARPFADADELFAASDHVWQTLTSADYLEAFRAHPRIGERAAAGSGQHSRWSADEQSGAGRATGDVRGALAEANDEYERRFGFIFIVCATGKSADEMLDLLRTRLGNDPATELAVAAEEQRKITRLRLEKLLASLGNPEIPK